MSPQHEAPARQDCSDPSLFTQQGSPGFAQYEPQHDASDAHVWYGSAGLPVAQHLAGGVLQKVPQHSWSAAQ